MEGGHREQIFRILDHHHIGQSTQKTAQLVLNHIFLQLVVQFYGLLVAEGPEFVKRIQLSVFKSNGDPEIILGIRHALVQIFDNTLVSTRGFNFHRE